MKYKLIINLKTYSQTTNEGAIRLAKVVKSLQKIAKKKDVDIILCPQTFDFKDIVKNKVIIFSQHIDVLSPGNGTGFNCLENLLGIGVSGSLISHSEHMLERDDIKKRIDLCKKFDVVSVVCARDDRVVKKISLMKPDYIAVEPKELIGGDISISNAKPDLIKKSVKISGKIPLLVGAGVKTSQDVRKSIELGARGILVASGVTKSNDFKKSILELLDGF